MSGDTPTEVRNNSQAHTRGCAPSFKILRQLLAADLQRYAGKSSVKAFLKHFLLTPGFKCTVWVRLTGYLKVAPPFLRLLYYPSKFLLIKSRYKFGIVIPEYMVIGPGLFINRFGGIYFHGDAIIGSNVNVTHGVVLGYMNRGPKKGSPTIGNEVFLGSGAKIIGNLKLGDRCAVGANAVVTKDFPEESVVGGIPAKLLSSEGSEGYINNKSLRVPDWMINH